MRCSGASPLASLTRLDSLEYPHLMTFVVHLRDWPLPFHQDRHRISCLIVPALSCCHCTPAGHLSHESAMGLRQRHRSQSVSQSQRTVLCWGGYWIITATPSRLFATLSLPWSSHARHRRAHTGFQFVLPVQTFRYGFRAAGAAWFTWCPSYVGPYSELQGACIRMTRC